VQQHEEYRNPDHEFRVKSDKEGVELEPRTYLSEGAWCMTDVAFKIVEDN
jgi:hypothetical protein